MKVQNMLLTLLLVVTACSVTALSQNPAAPPRFIACQSTYALCTFSPCGEVRGRENDHVRLPVKTDEWSVGMKACPTKKEVSEGQTKSRYFPIRTYSRCSNNRPWAMCLDKECWIDKNDPTKAKCKCSVKQGQGDYLVSPEKPGVRSQCDFGIFSSATVVDLDQITDFLQTQDKMPVYNFEVVNLQPK